MGIGMGLNLLLLLANGSYKHTLTLPFIIITTKQTFKIPSDLLLYAHISPIASACHDHPELLHRYMNYTPYSLCPFDTSLSESLILRGCHPLPRRRCFTPTPSKPIPSSYKTNNLFPSSFPDTAVSWSSYVNCKSFQCLVSKYDGFDMKVESTKFVNPKSDLDLPISQLLQIAKSASSVIRSVKTDKSEKSYLVLTGQAIYSISLR
ncbi:hypothetical protein MKW94_027627 [Papaver nudicaule]|uniref:Uncharacterized protein n=1 Tax=Papaver nudicaule TaxID=74823 RepID=A0AA41VPL4_PAPNU|nr:hypothetical protein [Papaver nudicaule]